LQERYGDEPKGCFRYSPEPNVELIQVYKWPAVLDLSVLKRAQYDESLLFATMEAVSASLAHYLCAALRRNMKRLRAGE
jgi:hypothetical protein